MLKPSLQFRLNQSLAMTPQLQQAIRLLQMPTFELEAHIAEILDSNVMLEQENIEDDIDTTVSLSTLDAQVTIPERELTPEVEILDEPWADSGSGSDSNNFDYRDDWQQDIVDEENKSLRNFLLTQLELTQLSNQDLIIATAIIDSINEDGYLTETLAQILEDIRLNLKSDVILDENEIERVLLLVQMLEPVGVAARNLIECLSIQLKQLSSDTPSLLLAEKIVANYLNLMANRDFISLQVALDIDTDALIQAMALVRSCNPRPGSIVSMSTPEYIIPDVFIHRTENGWTVEMNPSTLPRLKINNSYASMLGRNSTHTMLRTQLQEARWLIKSLEVRNETLLKVAKAIVLRQSNFLDEGEEKMRPMILKDIATAIAMHESTISRITSGKYMHTPRGVFELKYFFSSQVEGDTGQGTSSTAIRAKIRKLIRDEDCTNPFSDSSLTKILSAEGIAVARRTVAKYREGLGLASSSERKRITLA